MTVPPRLDLRGVRDDEGPLGPPPAREADERLGESDDDRPIRCAACRSPVTREDAATSVHGAHEHHRVNPSGVDFRVRCFARAPGAVGEGTPTRYWTWFPGYAWRLARCRACGTHLGWEFHGEGTFFGLIVGRLEAR
ncbi:MAG TPA: cereblon family protein [Sandaracinaceae bacterium LLY-WYZ-13_1]|nr:cereblon family protein [Sandaracinaceae bacterium LLY-WYZ-13_1]